MKRLLSRVPGGSYSLHSHMLALGVIISLPVTLVAGVLLVRSGSLERSKLDARLMQVASTLADGCCLPADRWPGQSLRHRASLGQGRTQRRSEDFRRLSVTEILIENGRARSVSSLCLGRSTQRWWSIAAGNGPKRSAAWPGSVPDFRSLRAEGRS